ncbi:hypothetical protein Emag_006035 [Eimeria magna]
MKASGLLPMVSLAGSRPCLRRARDFSPTAEGWGMVFSLPLLSVVSSRNRSSSSSNNSSSSSSNSNSSSSKNGSSIAANAAAIATTAAAATEARETSSKMQLWKVYFENVFFPWQTVSVHLSGSFLEARRLALRVPVNLTKFEIKNYLEKIYNAKVLKVNTLIKVPERRRNLDDKRLGYRRAGCTYKKAIVTLEDAIPDEVKMLRSSRKLSENPDLTKKNISYGANRDLRIKPNRHQLWQGGEAPHAWRLPIPNLLAGEDLQLHPSSRKDPETTLESPDVRLPFRHGVAAATAATATDEDARAAIGEEAAAETLTPDAPWAPLRL